MFSIDSPNEKEAEKKKIDISKENNKTRRWGDTRRLYDETHNLKPIKKNEIIINSSSNNPFINRFNIFCECFFYPIIRNPNLKTNVIKNDKKLLAEFVSFLTVCLENASKFTFKKLFFYKIINLENSSKFYYMIEETLNFLIQINDYSDLLVNRMKIQCLLKISIFIKKEIIIRYPLALDYLIKICQEISGFY